MKANYRSLITCLQVMWLSNVTSGSRIQVFCLSDSALKHHIMHMTKDPWNKYKNELSKEQNYNKIYTLL